MVVRDTERRSRVERSKIEEEISRGGKKGQFSVFLKACPAESLTAERPQSRANSGLPCIYFTVQPLIIDQTGAVTVTTAAVGLALTPLPNKPKCMLQAHANATQCISMSQSCWVTKLVLYTNIQTLKGFIMV